MPKWLRYSLFLLLGVSLGFLYLWLGQSRPDRAVLESGQGWVEPTPEPTISSQEQTITIIFAGDMMFDRNIRLAVSQQASQDKITTTGGDLADEQISYDFVLSKDLQQLLSQQDLVVANLEGPITDNESLSVNTEPGSPNNYLFTFDPAVVNFLQKYQMQVVNLGNNHILNFGLQGLETTASYLQAGGVEWFGWVGPESSYGDWNKTSIVWEQDGFSLGLVNYNQFGQQPLAQALAEISQLQEEVDWLVVYPHWGLEYKTTANQVIQNQAHAMIDAGADLVIGAHPHVVQQVEEYQGKKIFYSLGNFIFDQYFQEEVKQGLLVQLEFELEDDRESSKLGQELAQFEPQIKLFQTAMDSEKKQTSLVSTSQDLLPVATSATAASNSAQPTN